jgi:arylsulfatase A-like enzyme
MDRRPNIIVIITDQERSHKHWPKEWAEQNLTVHYDRLIGCKTADDCCDRSSAVFTNAFTATTECSPSRASLLTSSYPTEHGVVTTPGVLDPMSDRGTNSYGDILTTANERSHRPNLLRLLSSAQHTKSAYARGYNVSWKGKWHLCHSNDPAILNDYGATSKWNPPDAGHSLSVSYTLGGGMKYNHDGRFLRGNKRKFDVLLKQQQQSVDCGTEICSSEREESTEETEIESVFDFLSQQKLVTDGSRTQPFCLIASLVNPHDVWASSRFSKLSDIEFYRETGYHPRDFESIPIDLPPNRNDDLQSKPSIQSLMRSHPVFGDLSDSNSNDDDQQRKSDALRYVRFYAYLHKLVDDEIGSLLDELKATGQMDNTIIIRMADHGELGLSHAMR